MTVFIMWYFTPKRHKVWSYFWLNNGWKPWFSQICSRISGNLVKILSYYNFATFWWLLLICVFLDMDILCFVNCWKKINFNTFDLRFFSVVAQSNHMVTIDFGETSDVSKKNCGFISNIISGTLTPNGKFFKAL